MAYPSNPRRSAIGASTLALAAMLAASPVHAQQPPEPQPPGEAAPAEEPIIVTGSRIASAFNAPTPVTAIGAERLEERAIPNIGDALNELPAFRSTQTPASSGLGGAQGGYVGGRILDLRGLGAVRTLTLVDGKRFVPSTTEATVDTNMFPSILLSRVEVVTGGASAVYGSDAVSGVVNLLFDKQFEGLRSNAQFGAAGGTALGDTLHLVGGIEYERNTGVDNCT
ncbi:MAG TPA: TonB-dependent receptor plug domain-containing protein, partial [Croceibacterium sp.]